MPSITSFSGPSASAVTIQFVDSIATSPVVRLDLNNESPFMVSHADFSPPPLRRTRSSTMLADGDLVTAARHGNRMIVLEVECSTPNPDVASAFLSQLGIELNRDNNLLRVIVGSYTTFYRTYRAPDFKLDMVDWDGEIWLQSLTIEAEPYGLGLPISGSTLTLNADPASGGRFIDLPGVAGDVETPAQVLFQPSYATPAQIGTTHLAVRRRGNPAGLAHVVQAEAMSVGYDTAVSSAHSVYYSGAGNNYLDVSFATISTMANRAGFLFPYGATADARGSYRLLVRAGVTAIGSDVLFLQATYGGVTLSAPVALPDDGGVYLLDLGLMHAPRGIDPITQGFSSVPMNVAPDAVWIEAQRASGTTAHVVIDYAYLIPADDHLAPVFLSAGTTAGSWSVIDGPSNSVYQILDPAAAPWTVTPATHDFDGALPMLSPGNNRLYIVGQVGVGGAIGDTASVKVTYWPRYLGLATA